MTCPLDIRPISLKQLSAAKPKGTDSTNLVALLHPETRFDFNRQMSPMWRLEHVARIPVEDTPALILDYEVRDAVRVATMFLSVGIPLTVVCDTGAHNSIAMAQAFHRVRGTVFTTHLPGRPFLESVFHELARPLL
jgi:hypothetical protein